MSKQGSIFKLRELVEREKKKLERLSKEESSIRSKWNRIYTLYNDAAQFLAKSRQHGTKKEATAKEKVLNWGGISSELTAQRDIARRKITEQKEIIHQLQIGMARLIEQDKAETRAKDEIVAQVFSLNEAMIEALLARNAFLDRHVFQLLLDEEGNLRSQITFDNSDGTRRVVAMVNTITLVKPELAQKALGRISDFFDRINPQAQLDEATQTLFELTKKLLINRTSFKIGPDLYRFLSLDFNVEIFPELKEAQDLLKKSLRSEKTTAYVRLFQRGSRSDRWQPVGQS